MLLRNKRTDLSLLKFKDPILNGLRFHHAWQPSCARFRLVSNFLHLQEVQSAESTTIGTREVFDKKGGGEEEETEFFVV